jgi:hypothetical protein
VGLVNEAMADLPWPGEDLAGKEIKPFGNNPFQVVVANLGTAALPANSIPARRTSRVEPSEVIRAE